LEQAKVGAFEEMDKDILFKHYSTCKRVRQDYMVMPQNEDKCTGVWIWGTTGLGKSTRAREEYPDHYLKPCNKWWDGYRDEDNVIIEDIDPNHKVLGYHLKIWADKWSFPAEVKGTTIAIRPKKIVVTSQYSIDRIWEDDPETRDALKRRFKVIHMVDMYTCIQTIKDL